MQQFLILINIYILLASVRVDQEWSIVSGQSWQRSARNLQENYYEDKVWFPLFYKKYGGINYSFGGFGGIFYFLLKVPFYAELSYACHDV